MNITRFVVSVAAASALCASIAYAQTPDPAASPSSPSSASSPSQRGATQSNATEAPATPGAEPSDASSPHQRDAMKPAAGQDKVSAKQKMKDCMSEQSAKNAGISKSDMTKACHDQMKMQKDHSNLSSAPADAPK